MMYDPKTFVSHITSDLAGVFRQPSRMASSYIREHRDHRGETNGYHEVAIHLSGESAKHGETFSFSVFSVNSVA
jgi:hypothetical protein